MKNFIKLLTITLIFLLSASLHASEGGQGIPILDIGVGGKASAMGGAFISISDDATAILWNPAGMVQIDGDELILWIEMKSEVSIRWLRFTDSTPVCLNTAGER